MWICSIISQTILATRQEFFLTKVEFVQSITDIALLNFCLMLLSWMFILSCTTIFFFRKEIYLFKWLHINEYDIQMPLYVFWLRKGPSIKYKCIQLFKGWLFCAEVRSSFSKLIFTHFISCWSGSHEIVKI